MPSDTRFFFPFESFTSQAAFTVFATEQRAVLDQRYRYEMARAAAADPVLVQPGSCGLCLRATRFSTQLPAPAAPQNSPNWREQQVCDCGEGLTCRLRGLLHFITAEIDPPPWTRLLLLGAAHNIEARLQRTAASVAVRARTGRLLRAPRFEPQAYHLIISCEHLNAEPARAEVLLGLRDALMPGGHLVFTAPFDIAATHSTPAAGGNMGVLGWDILDQLAAAGFRGGAAHLYWSEEFGYLGPYNLVFSAVA